MNKEGIQSVSLNMWNKTFHICRDINFHSNNRSIWSSPSTYDRFWFLRNNVLRTYFSERHISYTQRHNGATK